MNPQVIRSALLEELRNVAPELELDSLPPDAELREELDLDSMDFLNWIAALHRRLQVDIPELDYPKLRSLDAATNYLASRLAR